MAVVRKTRRKGVTYYSGSGILGKHKLLLQEFWREFGKPPYGRRGITKKSKDKLITRLVEYGNIILVYRSSHDRKHFNEIKHRNKFTNFKYCFACGEKPDVRHHILWLKNGGRNIKKNIMALCNSCHAEVHPWLK